MEPDEERATLRDASVGAAEGVDAAEERAPWPVAADPPEADPELVALALWREGRKDEALQVVEGYLAAEKERAERKREASRALTEFRALATRQSGLPALAANTSPAILDLKPEPAMRAIALATATAAARRHISVSASGMLALGAVLALAFVAGAAVWAWQRADARLSASFAEPAATASIPDARSVEPPPALIAGPEASGVPDPRPTETPAGGDAVAAVPADVTEDASPPEEESTVGPAAETAEGEDTPPPEEDSAAPAAEAEADGAPPPESEDAAPLQTGATGATAEEPILDEPAAPVVRPTRRVTDPRVRRELAEQRALAEQYAARRRAAAEERAATERRLMGLPPLRYSRRVLDQP